MNVSNCFDTIKPLLSITYSPFLIDQLHILSISMLFSNLQFHSLKPFCHYHLHSFSSVNTVVTQYTGSEIKSSHSEYLL